MSLSGPSCGANLSVRSCYVPASGPKPLMRCIRRGSPTCGLVDVSLNSLRQPCISAIGRRLLGFGTTVHVKHGLCTKSADDTEVWSPCQSTGGLCGCALHRSREDFQGKSKRGSGMKLNKPMSFFESMDHLSTENCTAALAFGSYS